MLTAELVKSVVKPGTHWDGDTPGFGLRVNSGGGKSFFLNYHLGGRERRITIGKFPTWTVMAARARAKELRQQIDRGDDPAGDKRERREAATIQDLIDRYVRDHLPTKSMAKKRVTDEHTMLAMVAASLGKHTKVADVHHGDIEAMHRKISETRGPMRANRVLAIASKMFGMSLIPLPGENAPWRNALQGNPASNVKRNREEGRERFFSQAELAAISEALGTFENQTAADCVRLIMLTGCRPIEAQKAMWGEFKEPGFWVKPSAHTKQRKVHRLPLSPPAIELIERLRRQRKQHPDDRLFPNTKEGGELIATRYAWDHARKHAKLGADARLYDCRHTFASIGAGSGMSLQIIGRLLGHTQIKTTMKYAHLADDPVREAADKIGKQIAGAGEHRDNVVAIKR